MKCVSCRKETTYFIDANRILKCKKCKRKAQPNIKFNRCKHKFHTPDGLFNTQCQRCGVEADISLFNRPKVTRELPPELQRLFAEGNAIVQQPQMPKVNLPDVLPVPEIDGVINTFENLELTANVEKLD